MGQRMSEAPHIYGDDCIPCFDAGETPKYMYVRFSNIKKCVPHIPPACETPPNDHTFKLTQNPLVPCHFIYDGPAWRVELRFSIGVPPVTRLILNDSLGWLYFYAEGSACIDEGDVFYNGLSCAGVANCAHEGIAVVTWTQQATDLLESINMQRADDLFMELHPLVDGNLIYKFCRLQDATNIAIEFEPD